MLEFFLFFVLSFTFTASLLAGLWDLKTTEIPDEIPTLLAAVGIFSWYMFALTTGNFFPLLLSLIFGTAFLIFGWLLYTYGQWGGGDAKLLGAIAYATPIIHEGFFPINFFINLFFVGLIYMVIYTIVLGFLNRKIFSYFLKERKVYALLILSLISILMSFLYVQLIIFPIIFLATLFYIYCKTIEEKFFKKRISVRKLKIGDILADSKKLDGITKDELEKIRKTKRFVVIKEGVRFGPVFVINLIVTLYFGNLILLVI